MGKDELDTLWLEKIIEPIPAGRALDDGLMRSIERSEVGKDALGYIGQPLLTYLFACIIDSGDETVIFV